MLSDMSPKFKQNLFSILIILSPGVTALTQLLAGRISAADAAAGAVAGCFAALVTWLRPSPSQGDQPPSA